SKITCTYSYVVGTLGVGSHLSWGPDWQPENIAIHYMSNDPGAPYRRGFEAVGYPFEWVGREKGQTPMCERLVEGIRDKGGPVMAFGVRGAPKPSISPPRAQRTRSGGCTLGIKALADRGESECELARDHELQVQRHLPSDA